MIAFVVPLRITGLAPLDMEVFRAPASAPATTSVISDFNFADFRATPGPAAILVDSDIEAVKVEKPRKGDFVFIHPTWQDWAYIIPADFKKGREAYLVAPKVFKTRSQCCRRAWLVPYADADGAYALWPVMQEGSTGDINPFNRSAMRQIAKAAALGKWCQFEAVRGNQTYRLLVAHEQREAPKWPLEGLSFLIRIAFADRIITDPGDPIFLQLRGQEVE